MRQRLGAGDRVLRRSAADRFAYWAPRWRLGGALLAERLLLGGQASATCPYSWTNGDPNFVRHVVQHEVTAPAELWNSQTRIFQMPRHAGKRSDDLEVYTHLLPERHSYELVDVTVDLATGGCWTDGGWVLGEAAWSAGAGSLSRDVIHQWAKRPAHAIEEPCIVFPTDANYFHWLIDFMPPFLTQLNRTSSPSLRIIGDARAPRWAKDAAQTFGLKVNWLSRGPVRCQRYFVAGRGRSAIVESEGYELNRALPIRAHDHHDGGVRILLSRQGYSRSNPFTVRIEEMLGSVGFEIVSSGGMSVTEQKAVMANASVVVGWAGAAFANTVFLGPHAKAIVLSESKNSSRSWSHFQRIADIRGFELHGLLLNAEDDLESVVQVVLDAVASD